MQPAKKKKKTRPPGARTGPPPTPEFVAQLTDLVDPEPVIREAVDAARHEAKQRIRQFVIAAYRIQVDKYLNSRRVTNEIKDSVREAVDAELEEKKLQLVETYAKKVTKRLEIRQY